MIIWLWPVLPPVLECQLQRPRSGHVGCFSVAEELIISFPLLSLAVKIKKPIKTKFRMPVFNWVALKPNQINGTVFNEIDDERILEVRAVLAAFCSHVCPQINIGLCRDILWPTARGWVGVWRCTKERGLKQPRAGLSTQVLRGPCAMMWMHVAG